MLAGAPTTSTALLLPDSSGERPEVLSGGFVGREAGANRVALPTGRGEESSGECVPGTGGVDDLTHRNCWHLHGWSARLEQLRCVSAGLDDHQ